MKISKQSIRSKSKKIRLLLLDVDGVMTDGMITLDSAGNEIKSFHVRDGHGIKMAQRAGIIIGIITGRTSKVVDLRARELGITEVHQGALEKIGVYEKVLSRLGLRDEQVAFIGDDVVDEAILRRVGFSAAVADAEPSVRPIVHLVTKAAGGKGAVREVIDLILKSRAGSRPQ